jgi:hypothetical protein
VTTPRGKPSRRRTPQPPVRHFDPHQRPSEEDLRELRDPPGAELLPDLVKPPTWWITIASRDWVSEQHPEGGATIWELMGFGTDRSRDHERDPERDLEAEP